MFPGSSVEDAGAGAELSRRWRRALVSVGCTAAACILLLATDVGALVEQRYLAMLVLAVPVFAVLALLTPSLTIVVQGEDATQPAEALRAEVFRHSYHILLTALLLAATFSGAVAPWSGGSSGYVPGLQRVLSLAVVLAFVLPLMVAAWITPEGMRAQPVGLRRYLAAHLAALRRRPRGLAVALLITAGVLSSMTGAVAHAVGTLGGGEPLGLATGGAVLILVGLLLGLRGGSVAR